MPVKAKSRTSKAKLVKKGVRKDHLQVLQKEIKVTNKGLKVSFDRSAKRLEELLDIIRRPGWTTLPEYMFTRNNLKELSLQAKLLDVQTKNLLAAARKVGK